MYWLRVGLDCGFWISVGLWLAPGFELQGFWVLYFGCGFVGFGLRCCVLWSGVVCGGLAL